MSAAKEIKWPFIVNLSNSIIGVSVLAMPFCLMQCGILLGLLLMIGSNILTRVTSHLLLKGAHLARRRSYELYTLHVFGPKGKVLVELMTVLFLLSTCCAFFVVIGDLGPHIVADFFGITTVTGRLRTLVMVLIGVCVVLPLSLLRNIHSLSSVSSLAILFYGFFVVRMFLECLPRLLAGNWFSQVNWWRPEGVLKSLPIIGLSLSCQTNLFSTAESMVEYSPTRMDAVVSGAVNLCSTVYMAVGFCGYVAYFERSVAGDILVYLDSSFFTQLIKFAFMLSVAVSFPLMLFPCRTAIFSMFFKPAPSQDLTVEVIPDTAFRFISIVLISGTLFIAILIPRVEFILGLTGSLIGSGICIVGPAVMYLQIAPQHHFYSRISAQVCLVAGLFILIVCTYATLRDAEGVSTVIQVPEIKTNSGVVDTVGRIPSLNVARPVELKKPAVKGDENIQRKEPPLPQVPQKEETENKAKLAAGKEKKDEGKKPEGQPADHDVNVKQAAQLIKELKNQQEESKKLLEQQKQLVQELKEQKIENQAQNDEQGQNRQAQPNIPQTARINQQNPVPPAKLEQEANPNIQNPNILHPKVVKKNPEEEAVLQRRQRDVPVIDYQKNITFLVSRKLENTGTDVAGKTSPRQSFPASPTQLLQRKNVTVRTERNPYEVQPEFMKKRDVLWFNADSGG